MLEGRARVLTAEGDFARLEIQRPSSCGGCGASTTCGTALLGRWLSRRPLEVQAANPVGARPGDWVVVGLADEVLTEASLLAYLTPLLGLFLGGGAGQALGGEPAAILGAVAGLTLGLGGAGRFAGRRWADPAYRAEILRRAADSSQRVPLVSPSDFGVAVSEVCGLGPVAKRAQEP